MTIKTISTDELQRVSRTHILGAINFLRVYQSYSNFRHAKNCYLLFDKCRPLAVKMVFGKALSICRDGERIVTNHFNSRSAVKILTQRGFQCINTEVRPVIANLNQDHQYIRVEGAKRIKNHYGIERCASLSRRKKQHFKFKHGRLFCENCGFDPIPEYGEYADACIEVHHKIPLSYLNDEQVTTFDDLQCLCANCHRVEHMKLRLNPPVFS